MKTKAAILYKTNEPLHIEELAIAEPAPGQALVRVLFSGICRSQLNEIQGKKGEDKFLPHTLGHEGSGVVEAVGQGVKKVKPGDHVVITWIAGDGANVPGSTYATADGARINSGAVSTFMDKALISENRLVKIDKKMPLRTAALLGCAIPTGAGMVINTACPEPGSTAAVFGAGGIGLSAILALRLSEAKQIIAVDVIEHKLAQAIQAGATHSIDASSEDARAKILELTNGRGVDLAIECAGKIATMEAAFASVRDKGGLCILAGNPEVGKTISIDPFDLIKGKKIVGSWGGEAIPDEDIPFYVEQYLSGKLDLDMLITHEYKLEEINQAMSALDCGNVGRALIKM